MSGGGGDGAGERPAPVQRRYHLHLPGLVYVVVTFFVAVGAFNSQNNLLFWALGLAIAALLVSGVVSGASLMGLRVERELPGAGAVGQPLVVRYAVTNTNRFVPAFGLTIEELPGPGSERGKWGGWGRASASWARFVRLPPALVLHVGASETVHVETIAAPIARGRAPFGAVRAWTTFPFGIAKKSVTFAQPGSCVIRPRQLPLRGGLVRAAVGRAEVGPVGVSGVGESDGFFGLREYVPGDSSRRIAWKPSARTGELVVRQNTALAPAKLWIIVRLSDDAGAPGGAARDERAISLAASVAVEGHREGLAVGLGVAGTDLARVPRTGVRHLDQILDDLGDLQIGPARDGRAGAAYSAGGVRGGGCIVVHAGEPTRGDEPAHAAHLSAERSEDYLARGGHGGGAGERARAGGGPL